ncbi:MAG: hypothetical protein M1837_003777 [Sclerophora amabilis]|nr:MAG: hypothetical protein M1837_003777 [Sclerophora amabilis]
MSQRYGQSIDDDGEHLHHHYHPHHHHHQQQQQQQQHQLQQDQQQQLRLADRSLALPAQHISARPSSKTADPVRQTRDAPSPSFLDGRASRQRPAPSPLHSFENYSPASSRADPVAADHAPSLPFPRPPAANDTLTSTSPSSSPVLSSSHAHPHSEQPRSPRERLDALLATESAHYTTDPSSKVFPPSEHSNTASGSITPSAPKSSGASQARNVSAPLLSSRASEAVVASPSPSTTMMASSTPSYRTEFRPAVRTSSIDSAISSLSSQASHSQKSSHDSAASSPTDIAGLISAAGSAEAAIQYLLKEKQAAAAQNAQLWRLVDKQRTMILGLNKDLERALKEKEKHRKKLKEHQGQAAPTPSGPTDHVQGAGRVETRSPASSEPVGAASLEGKSMQDIISGGLREPDRESKPDLDRSSEPVTAVRTTRREIDSMNQEDSFKSLLPKALNNNNNNNNNNSLREAPFDTSRALTPSSKREDDVTPRNEPSNDHILSLSTDVPSSQSSPHAEENRSPRGFGESRAAPKLTQPPESPILAPMDRPPMAEKSESIAPPLRKPPPAPLDLAQQNSPSHHLHELGPNDHSGSEYDDILEVDEIPAFGRGRRKTREEDDREREIALKAEKEHRSKSKKEKTLKAQAASPTDAVTTKKSLDAIVEPARPTSPPTKQAVPISPPPSQSRHLSPPGSLASVLNPSINETLPDAPRLVSPPPMSPGLPLSPRPTDRPVNSPTPRMPRDGSSMSSLASPPLSPRPGVSSAPLSPRAPRYPIPLPPNTPISLGSPELPGSDGRHSSTRGGQQPRVEVHVPEEGPPDESTALGDDARSLSFGTVYRGFVSEQFPDLLLPPNALPSVQVKVSSSRLKPSRASIVFAKSKPLDEEAVFTLGVFARADGRELWRLEKDIMSLPHLDLTLKRFSKFSVKIPDRGLFSGHAPAKVDARRTAVDHYFDAVMNTPMDERSALVLCQYLSTDAIEPSGEDSPPTIENPTPGTSFFISSDAQSKMEGYLTKRGKNFGGWKARFFSLDGPILNYYDAPGGHLLGAIKLQQSKIGKQSSRIANNSPSRGDVDDSDNQYRHAFLILEPKKKDSNSLVRHILCAESDVERDEWVSALLQHVEYHASEEDKVGAARTAVKSEGLTPMQSRKKTPVSAKSQNNGDRSPSFGEDMDKLRAVSYEDTVEGEAPRCTSMQSSRRNETPSPPTLAHGSTAQIAQSHTSKFISGPTNGVRIEDAGSWGNKPMMADKKEQKKRGIWGFRGRGSSDSILHTQTTSGPETNQSHQHDVERTSVARAVFGAPLAEAAEFSRPVGVDVHLPAVVYRCIEYLDAKGATDEEGLFRLSGSNVVIKSLRERFNTEGDVNFLAGEQYYDVHAVASLLKLYLRELPSTVLTRELHLDFLHVTEIEDKEQKVAALHILVYQLPRANHSLLRALSSFLITIVSNSDVNKMTVRNVGIVFAPTLNIPAPVISLFLTSFDDIFGYESDEFVTTPMEVSISPPQELTAEDIRSPRRQMFQDLPTPAYNQTSFNGHRASQLYPTDDSSRAPYDTGFIPLQPSYEPPSFGQKHASSLPHQGPPETIAGAEYGSLNGALAPSHSQQDLKAKRRESSMMSLALPSMGYRKSSMPQLREPKADLVSEESAFD